MTFYGSSEDLYWAANKMSDAADRMTQAADRVEESVRTLQQMLEPGYGGAGQQLIELLQAAAEAAQEKPKEEKPHA